MVLIHFFYNSFIYKCEYAHKYPKLNQDNGMVYMDSLWLDSFESERLMIYLLWPVICIM